MRASRLILPLVLLAPLCLFACGGRSPAPLGGEIADLRQFPQDLRVYAHAVGPDTLLLTEDRARLAWNRFETLLYAPWRAEYAAVKAEDAFALLRGRGYGENLLPRTDEAVRAVIENSQQQTYPNIPEAERYGITLRATSLRAAPTDKPRFNDPLRAGQGFPFDMWQYATLPPGMPVYMTHLSRDGSWVFVENALAAGWVAEPDLALTDEAYREQAMGRPLLAVLSDGALIRDVATGRVVVPAGLGTVLPLVSEDGDGFRTIVPLRTRHGAAEAVQARISRDEAALAPLTLTPGALADIGNTLMGQPYGWGSLYRNRDCSAMLRDVFVPFGIWLPRNSAAQARAWTYIDLENLQPNEKLQALRAQGKPFMTLLSFPGHIGLYLGAYDGRPAMFHDMWGIRTEAGGQEGRYVVGRVLVSSLEPGAELDGLKPEATLLHRLRGLSVLE